MSSAFGYRHGKSEQRHINIDNYVNFFSRKQFDINCGYKKKIGIKSKERNNDYDKLFFNFLIMINYDFVYEYNRSSEQKIKINIIERINEMNIKYKTIEKVLDKMTYSKNISVDIFDLLAKAFNLNIILYDDSLYYCVINNQSNNKIYCIDYMFNLYEKEYENIEFIKQDKYEIKNLQKPFYSMSHYKLDELKEIYKNMGLEESGKMKKKEYYDEINKYFKNSIFYQQENNDK